MTAYDGIDKGTEVEHYCNKCLISFLPNYTTEEDDPINIKDESDTTPPPRPSDVEDNHFECFKEKGMHFIHLNACSLRYKIHELRLIAVKSQAAVIGVTETWLDDSISDAEISLPGYVIVRQDRKCGGGGVCIYIRTCFAFNHRSDIFHKDLEMVWVEIMLPHCKPFLVGTCYRPPDNVNFYEILEQTCVDKDRFMDMENIVMGDFNTNTLNKSQNKLLKSLHHFTYICDWSQTIAEPTRVTATSESCLDLIMVSDKDKISQFGTINIGLSDHMLTYCTRKISRGVFGKHKTVKIRSMKNYSTDLLVTELRKLNWFIVIDCDQVNEAWVNFKDLFTSVLDKLAPIKEVRLKQRTEPWMENDILELIKARDKALHSFRSSKDVLFYAEYCKLRISTMTNRRI